MTLFRSTHERFTDPGLFVCIQLQGGYANNGDEDLRITLVEHCVLQLSFGINPGESLRHFTFLVNFNERHSEHVRRLIHRWRHLSFLSLFSWLILRHESREKEPAPVSSSALMPKTHYVFGLAQKSRTAILRCYSVVRGSERTLAITHRREHEVDFLWIELRVLLPEKIPLRDWFTEGGAVLDVNLPVIFRNLVQAVVLFDFVDNLAHLA